MPQNYFLDIQQFLKLNHAATTETGELADAIKDCVDSLSQWRSMLDERTGTADFSQLELLEVNRRTADYQMEEEGASFLFKKHESIDCDGDQRVDLLFEIDDLLLHCKFTMELVGDGDANLCLRYQRITDPAQRAVRKHELLHEVASELAKEWIRLMPLSLGFDDIAQALVDRYLGSGFFDNLEVRHSLACS